MKKATNRTDWDVYYSKNYKITSFTRKTTERLLLKFLRKFCGDLPLKSIIELGGANSCFYSAIVETHNPIAYHVVDNNEVGLNKFNERIKNDSRTSFENANVLSFKPDKEYDIAFSIGLIEHFDREGTAKVIKTHFDSIKKNGIVIVSFPTPTLLYLIVRKICEIVGIWFFYDERPLKFSEVIHEVSKHGVILHRTINWKVILTQGFLVARKR